MPLLIFSHASSFGARTYGVMFDSLRQRGFSVEAIERFGHAPEYPVSDNWPHLVQQLIDFARAKVQQTGEPAYLVGHSFGGRVAMQIALIAPERVRALVAISPEAFATELAQILGLRSDGPRASPSDRPAPLAQHEAAVPQGLLRRRRRGLRGALPRARHAPRFPRLPLRFRAPDHRAGNAPDPARRSAERTGPALTLVPMALLTTLAGYALLATTPFPGLQQVALFSAAGLAAASVRTEAFVTIVVPESRLSREAREFALAGMVKTARTRPCGRPMYK
mgnify:CR=1 FL=1